MANDQQATGLSRRQVERTVARVIDALTAGHAIEDASVELKREWPSDPIRAAWSLGAHANAALGAPIYWLIGIDEGKRAATGTDPKPKLDWWSKVQTNFDAISPRLVHDLDIRICGQTVCVLPFETLSAPYVVRVPGFGSGAGSSEWGIPWREGTAARSARRHEIMRMRADPTPVPNWEVLSVSASEIVPTDGLISQHGPHFLRVQLHFFLSWPKAQDVILPLHRCRGHMVTDRGDSLDRQLSLVLTDSRPSADLHDHLRFDTAAGLTAWLEIPVCTLNSIPSRFAVSFHFQPTCCDEPIRILTAFRRGEHGYEIDNAKSDSE